ncbi:hypothetical protein B566_EDAN014726 [Ephemera danica]|nr:hypothetical protein B566_EDAN014726 [Ephemera danica]
METHWYSNPRSHYKLDPAHYFTLAGFAWDATLRIKKIKLELLTDYDMHLMIEKGIRRGIAQCCKRYSVANNQYLRNKKGEFTWMDPLELIFFETLEDHGEFGYTMEVDVSYPPQLHDMHTDVPLLAEHKIMSSGQSKLATLHDKKNYA